MNKNAGNIKANELCPCGSKKPFRYCCYNKSFKWAKNEEGNYSRVIPIAPELTEVIKDTEMHFLAVMGRKPRKDDPLLLDQYLHSLEDIEREVVQVMERAGTDPAHIYAYQKTGGLILTEYNRDLLPDREIQEWESAVDEYNSILENPPVPTQEELDWNSCFDELPNCIIVFGYCLEYGGNPKYRHDSSNSDLIDYESYAMLCATRSFKTLQSIRYLLDKDIGDDALSLVRSLYENYLHIIYTKAHPTKLKDLVDAVGGLKRGTHEYARNAKGEVDPRRIVERLSGKSFEGHISNYRMAKSSEYESDLVLFTYLYEFLSEHTHPNINTAYLLIGNNNRLDHRVRALQHEAILYSLCLSCLILDEIRLLKIINASISNDIKRVSVRISRKTIRVLSTYFDPKLNHIKCLIDRLHFVGKRTRANNRFQGTLHKVSGPPEP